MRDATSALSGGGRWWYVPLMGAGLLLAACQPMGSAAIAPDPNMAMGCEQAEAFAFSGQTTLAAIGLEEFSGGPDAQRTGMIWVTADPVSMFGPGPPPPGMADDTQRMVCVQWPDGSGMAGPVPPGWEPPSTLNLDATSEDGPPFVLIGLVLAAALIGGVSFVAFRGETS
ncbi:MAG: hypothetical protein LC744_01710 [Chloroflexi bacterium]|nr:hypothetical protein [Chloroflexota bacterium]